MTERTKSQIGRASRRKGQVGEMQLAAELSALLGIEIKRRVRNHQSDSDIVGLDGWSAECKVCAAPALSAWWKQTVEQSSKESGLPVLFYRLPRRPFKAVLPICLLIGGEVHADVEQTIEVSLEGFAAVYREIEATSLQVEMTEKTLAMCKGERLQ